MSGHNICGALACAVVVAQVAMADEILLEAEGYTRSEYTLQPVQTIAREGASGSRLLGVRAADTGFPTWAEYDVTVAGGLYEIRLRAGGNDSRQAGRVSLDGGAPLTVLDDPQDALPLDGPLPQDFRERSRLLERTFREHLVGCAELPAGRHRVRVQHAGLAGRSNAFGFDWIRLTRVESSDAPRMEVGTRPDPEGGATHERLPFEVHVLTSYRFWGPGEAPVVGLLCWNRELPGEVEASFTLDLVTKDSTEVAQSISYGHVRAAQGEAQLHRYELNLRQVPRGAYWLVARVTLPGGQTVSVRAELVCADLNTPAWAKRARTAWTSFGIGSDVRSALANVKALVEAGVNTTIVSVGDWLGEEAISYPFRGDDDGWRQYLAGTHNLGACHLMYHTMVTVSEHFYYEHRAFWGGRKPYYHCSWLSVYPDSPDWNRYQAADFEYALGRHPLDGVFLDNACASGAPGIRTPDGEAGIARHQSGLRAAIKRSNPIGVLYPNYNVLAPEGLRTVSAAWDAHMLEGVHPEPADNSAQGAWPTRQFVTVMQRVRALTGKPFWPLMYTPGQYGGLGIAACAAARCNPTGPVNATYLRFLHDIQEYIYADDVFPAPEGTVRLVEQDPDLVATALVKAYLDPEPPPGVADFAHAATPRDWIIQIVNGTERDGKLVAREVELQLELPSRDLRRPAWVLRPESAAAEPLKLSNPLKLTVGTWAVLFIAEELLPRVRVSPPCLRPVPGEDSRLQVQLQSWTQKPVDAVVKLDAPAGWSGGPDQPVANGAAMMMVKPPDDAPTGNLELGLRVALPAAGLRGSVPLRTMTVPVIARVRSRLEVCLRPDHFAVFPSGTPQTPPRTKLCLTNHTAESLQARLSLSAPAGWSVTPAQATLEIPQGETAELPCRLTWPDFRPQSLYDLRDARMQIAVDCGEGQRTESIPVRLHMPATWLIYCPLGTRPADVVRTGATPGGGFLSDIVMTVRATPNHMDDAQQALAEAIRRQKAGEQRVVVWFRTGGDKGSDQLAEPGVQASLRELMGLGGGVILQENLFRDSVPNRALLDSDLCPIGGPYEATDTPGGDWTLSAPEHPAVARFAANALEGRLAWGLPASAQPETIRFAVKPWAQVVARNALGDPVVVVSTDPARPIVYLAGSLEGAYIDNRFGLGDYPDQMYPLLYFYAELARWLSVFQNGR